MRLRKGLILREMGAEFVIVDPSQDVVDMSKVFTLNETAAFIWKELENTEFGIENIANLLTNHYEVEYNKALVDAKSLFEQFAKEGLFES